jgi:hypothetical protein
VLDTCGVNADAGFPAPPPFSFHGGANARVVEGRRLTRDAVPLHLKGVNWHPVPVGSAGTAVDFAAAVAVDAELMQAANINAVRTYVPLTDVAVLDALWARGIFVLNTIYADGNLAAASVDAAVAAVKDHPAILLYVVGNEWNYNYLRSPGGASTAMTVADAQARVANVSARLKSLDPATPVATVYGDLPPASTLAALPDVDIWGVNVYGGFYDTTAGPVGTALSFGKLFTEWEALSTKPLFVGEYGGDSWNVIASTTDEAAQALVTAVLTSEIFSASTLRGGVALGGFVFRVR